MWLLEVSHSVLLLRAKLSEYCMKERSCTNKASDFHKWQVQHLQKWAHNTALPVAHTHTRTLAQTHTHTHLKYVYCELYIILHSDGWENLFSRSELTWPSVKYHSCNLPVLDTHDVMHIINNGDANCKCKADAKWARAIKSTFHFQCNYYHYICNFQL